MRKSRTPHDRIPESLWTMLNDIYEVTVYSSIAHLSRQWGYCYASLDVIAERRRMSRKTVQRTIGRLREKSFVEAIQTFRMKDGLLRKHVLHVYPTKALNYFFDAWAWSTEQQEAYVSRYLDSARRQVKLEQARHRDQMASLQRILEAGRLMVVLDSLKKTNGIGLSDRS